TLSDGSAVVTWDSFGQDGSGSGVYGQRFELQGPPSTNKPIAAPDHAVVRQESSITVDGSHGVLSNDRSANASHHLAVSGIGNADHQGYVGVPFAGKYGTLTLNFDGSYTYVVNPHSANNVYDSFAYTVRDEESGASTQSTLTIGVAPPPTLQEYY